MEPEPATQAAARSSLHPRHVFVLGAICLVAGLAIGYVCVGSSTRADPSRAAATVASRTSVSRTGSAHPVTLADMKQMADRQAEPLLRKLNGDPHNTAVLAGVGAIYHVAHQYSEAAVWYERAVQSDPGNAELRTKLATSLYRQGDVNGALTQLNEALKINPADANALFNLGMIRLEGKGDGRGAVAEWRQLLKTNPQLSTDRRVSVEKLIAEVTANLDQQARSVRQ